MDQTIQCVECREPFVFSEKEQDFFKSKNFVAPKRCLSCRRARKANSSPPMATMGDLPNN